MSYNRSALDNAVRMSNMQFKQGKQPLLGSRLIKSAQAQRDAVPLFGVLFLIFIVVAYPMGITMSIDVASLEATIMGNIVLTVFYIAYLAYGLTALAFIGWDLNNLECYTFGYKQSTYYRSTGVEKETIPQDAGLVGEFNGYVLSRKLTIPHRVLYNVCIPMPNGNFQEVDCIIITAHMIYVIECKNRSGYFQGSYDDAKWIQRIGSKQHESENIYMQNQKHTMAIDQFLLERGIIENGGIVCMNVIMTTAKMSLPTQNMPMDLVFGNMNYVCKTILKYDKEFSDGSDTSSMMDEVYLALLPYALYTEAERAHMMDERQERSESKELAIGPFQIKNIPEGIPGITEPGESAYIRWNKCYTQLYVTMGNQGCWQTRTDIPESYKY